MFKSRYLAIAAAASLVLPLAACGSGDADTAATTTATEASGDAEITVTNCGITYKLDSPVQRAVTLEQGQTETLLALGVADQMAGTSHLKDDIRAEWQADFDKVPILSEEPATGEQIREADADFIFSGFKANYTRDKAGDRKEWEDLGVVAFLTNTECRDLDENKDKTAFELMEKDYKELGEFFDKEEKAKELIAEQEEAIANAQATAETLEGNPSMALFYSSYDGAPYIAGRTSLAQDMIEFVGGTNVFEDVNEDWPTISWEAFADRDPDIIILADISGRGYPGDKYEEKIAELESNAATRNLSAVQNKRYIVVPAIGLSPNVRSPEALNVLADALKQGVGNGIVGAKANGQL